jgi:hypothetical protein
MGAASLFLPAGQQFHCEISSSHGGEYEYYSSLMMEAVRTSETSVDNHFTQQYNPEDSSEQQFHCFQSLYALVPTATEHCCVQPVSLVALVTVPDKLGIDLTVVRLFDCSSTIREYVPFQSPI